MKGRGEDNGPIGGHVLPFNLGLVGCSETSVTNYQFALRKISVERRSLLTSFMEQEFCSVAVTQLDTKFLVSLQKPNFHYRVYNSLPFVPKVSYMNPLNDLSF